MKLKAKLFTLGFFFGICISIIIILIFIISLKYLG